MSEYSCEFSMWKASKMAENHADEMKCWKRFRKVELVWSVSLSVSSFLCSFIEWYYMQAITGIMMFFWLWEVRRSQQNMEKAAIWLKLRQNWMDYAATTKFNE